MNDSTLERVSVAYRRGYRDGEAGRPRFCEVKPEYIKPFANFDYEEGYQAGENDAKWARIYAERDQSKPVGEYCDVHQEATR